MRRALRATHRTPNMVHLQKLLYFNWPNCYRLANSQLELIFTTDVGPRIVRAGFVGGQNFMAEFPAAHGQTGGGDWVQYGGHRLWHAPEQAPRTYQPDNGPVTLEEHADFVRLIQPMEPATGLQKEIDLHLAPEAPHVRVTHRLRNNSMWEIEAAVWALSVMAPNGVAVVPLPPRAPHSTQTLLPTSQLTLWSYTDLADKRLTLGTRYILLRQDAGHVGFQKIGVRATDGWAGYWLNGELFLKTFHFYAHATYPDFNTPVEVFTDAEMLELETLGPLTRIAPGATVEHTENWRLFRGVGRPTGDADVEAEIAPKAASLLERRLGSHAS
ncbi:MAG: hypothetical protein JNL09_05100 [Anaerolineales bacterium]|nr:hypothetical protein [Anaerolineales bacterium]